jgi:hypothetical protein
VIRTREEILKSMGMHPGASADCSDECINRVAIIHAGVNIRALAGDYGNPFHGTPAQLESAVNALLDCEERMRDIGSGDDT